MLQPSALLTVTTSDTGLNGILTFTVPTGQPAPSSVFINRQVVEFTAYSSNQDIVDGTAILDLVNSQLLIQTVSWVFLKQDLLFLTTHKYVALTAPAVIILNQLSSSKTPTPTPTPSPAPTPAPVDPVLLLNNFQASLRSTVPGTGAALVGISAPQTAFQSVSTVEGALEQLANLSQSNQAAISNLQAQFTAQQLQQTYNATQINILDNGNQFTGSTVETALQETLTQARAASLYLKQTDAAATYQPQASMSQYVSVTTANSTYQPQAGMALYAPLNSPTFTGRPAAPTAPVDTSSTQIATTAFVMNEGFLKSATAAATYQPQSSMAAYLTTFNANATYAPLNSPALSGTPSAPTPVNSDNSTRLATTAYVQSVIAGVVAGTAATDTVTVVNSNTTLTPTNAGLVIVDASSNAVTLTLPLSSAKAGTAFRIVRRDASANSVTVMASGTDTFDYGATTQWTLPAKNDWHTLEADGQSNWVTLATTTSLALDGTPTAPTAAVDSSSAQLATTAYVINQGYLKSATAATTYQTQANMTTYAPKASPVLTGTPTAPTAAVDTATAQLATTQYVVNQGYLKTTTAASTYQTQAGMSSYAALASPVFTGTPTAPTATANSANKQIATTEYVDNGLITKLDASGTATNSLKLGGLNANAYAPLASPVLTGTPAAPTAALDTATTQLATTAYVVNQGYLKAATAAAAYAPLVSPTFTGTPVAPTAPTGTNSQQLATTQFVQSAVGAVSTGTATTLTTSTTLTPAYAGLVLVDASGGNVTVTLPAANSKSGLTFQCVRHDNSANTVTVIVSGADTLDGGGISFTLPQAGSCTVLASDGVSLWETVASNNNVTLTGIATAPTAAVDTSSLQLATTAFVVNQGYLKSAAAATTYAPLNSPNLTGTPQINGVNIAKQSDLVAASSTLPLMDGAAAIGVGTTYARNDHVHPTDTSRAPLNSPNFTGTPQIGGTAIAKTSDLPVAASTTPAPLGTATVGVATTYARADHVHAAPTTATTQAPGNNSTSIATTAYVDTGLGTKLNTTAQAADAAKLGGVVAASYALLNNPAFTGLPTAPTAVNGTNTQQLATCAFVLANTTSNTVTNLSASTTLSTGQNGLVLVNATSGAVTLTLPPAASSAGVRYVIIKKDSSANAVTLLRTGSDVFDSGATSETLSLQGDQTTLTSDGSSTWRTGYTNANTSLTGVPTAPTAPVDTATAQLASTAFVMNQGYVKAATAAATYQTQTGMSSYAPLASPAFTGTPTAPTAAPDTSSGQLASTAFVINQGYLKSATAATTYQPQSGMNSYAPLASPVFTGTPIAPTVPQGNNSQQLATTAYVDTGLLTRLATTAQAADSAKLGGTPAAAYALLNGPALTGVPTAPTAAAGTNSTQLATTAFVATSFAPLASPAFTGAASFQGRKRATSTKTAAYTASATDDVLRCDATGAAFAVTLPAASGCVGQVYVIKKIDTTANAVTVTPSGTDKIDGLANSVLKTAHAVLRLQSYGSGWDIL